MFMSCLPSFFAGGPSLIGGTVTDPSGTAIEGARVEAVSLENGKQRELSTNSAGVYTIPNLPLGNYTVTITKSGFAALRFDSVVLKVGAQVTLNAQLQLASTQTKIQVIDTEPALNTTSAVVSGVIDSNQILNLPTNGRNWAGVLVLAPLAIDDGGGDQRSIRLQVTRAMTTIT
jgi:Carboxypeptidase regulatory-like domain